MPDRADLQEIILILIVHKLKRIKVKSDLIIADNLFLGDD